jgi:uncharacterized protein
VKLLCSILLLAWCRAALAAEVIPPVPKQWFNDDAGVVSAGAAARLNKTLEDFERETSSQIIVAVFPKMQSDSSIEDYTVRVAEAWKVGQKGRNNGAVLFVFIQDRKMFIQVGYGLEGVLPDAFCKRIIADEITPRFRNQDFDGGLSAGVRAILAATKGEYHRAERSLPAKALFAVVAGAGFLWRWHGGISVLLLPLLVALIVHGIQTTAIVYGRRGRRSKNRWSDWSRAWRQTASVGGSAADGGGWSGGGSSGGGDSGGSSGGFSAGGGSFGGGGAGGSW